MPKVSVIIPAYNAMAYLPQTLQSALDQTFTDFEVLVINDGSSDQILEWADQIQDPRVRLITQENQGLSGARNTGIWQSQGEYLAFLDADDLWEPTKLEKQAACLDHHSSVGLVSSWVHLIDHQGSWIASPQAPNSQGDDLKRELFLSNIVLCGSTPMVRRCCFEKVGFFDRTLRSIEDWDMWLRLVPHYQLYVIQEPLVQYRKHSNSMSKNFRVMVESANEVMTRAFQLSPPNYRHLKGIAISSICIETSWTVLIEKEDLKEAFIFARMAALKNPKVIFSRRFLHLIALILIKENLEPHWYKILILLRNKMRSKHPRRAE
jgi:glycosyltransferase involved in cell wall biosynthesis